MEMRLRFYRDGKNRLESERKVEMKNETKIQESVKPMLFY